MTAISPLPPGYRHQAFASVGSTSEVALAAARQGDRGPLWITAGQQTEGRGRRGRSWQSPAGNLYASLFLADPGPLEVTATLAFVAGVALRDALADCVGAEAARVFALKWPNDVLASGSKIAGILIDGETLDDGRRAIVIGLGVNCVSHPASGTSYPTTDLAAIGMAVEPGRLFQCLATRLAEAIETWNAGRGFSEIRARWKQHAFGLGRPIRVEIDGRIVEGLFDDLDDTGRLLVAGPDGTRRAVSAGDVFFAAEV